MRLPFLQMESDLLAHGAPQVASLAGCLPVQALGHIAFLRAWAVAQSTDESPPDGWARGEDAADAIEAAAQWGGEPGRLLRALKVAKLVEVTPEGVRVLGLEPYVVAWQRGESARLRRERTAYPHILPVEEIQDAVVIPRIRIRLKTPEERAEAEEQGRRAMEEHRARIARDNAHKEAIRAAKAAGARVYFIQQDGGERLVKIGMTTRAVEVRLKELQGSNAQPLVIRASAPGGRAQEGVLHCRFAAMRVVGEWFRPDAELISYMGRVADNGVL